MMKFISIFFFFLFSLFVDDNLIFAQFGAEIQAGSRQQGMGEAFVGVADDGEAVYYNPAGLVNLDYIEVKSMYARQLAHLGTGANDFSLNISYMGYAQNFGDRIGSIGVRWFYRGFSNSDIFNASEHLLILGYGRKLGDIADVYPNVKWVQFLRHLSFGIGLKFMNYGFYDSNALANNPFTGNESDLSSWSWSTDISFFYRLNERLNFGFIFKDYNRPNSASIDGVTYLDKMDYNFGTAYRYSENLLDIVAVDMISENSNYSFNIGTEKYWNLKYEKGIDQIILRTGVKVGFEDDYNWSLGFGYKLTKIGSRMGFDSDFDLRFDYAYKVLFGNISSGPTNHSLELVFFM